MVRYTNVQASVVDITTDSPKPTDRFLVDTNVWFWQAYSKATSLPNPPTFNQQFDYPDFIAEALNANSTLYRCELAFSELAHLIEKTEFEIFSRTNPNSTPKEFRHNHLHRR
jgi:hypothetical protein